MFNDVSVKVSVDYNYSMHIGLSAYLIHDVLYVNWLQDLGLDDSM